MKQAKKGRPAPGGASPGLGQRVRALREQRGLTQRALADRLQIDYVTMNRYERGRLAIPLARLEAIAAALDVDVYDLKAAAEAHATAGPSLEALVSGSTELRRWLYRFDSELVDLGASDRDIRLIRQHLQDEALFAVLRGEEVAELEARVLAWWKRQAEVIRWGLKSRKAS